MEYAAYCFRKKINNDIHPAIKHNPPMGVMGPKIKVKLLIPVNCLVANKKREPEKKSIPIVKNRPANCNDFEEVFFANSAITNKAIA